MKIILQNFQNIDYSEINLVKGLNVITGLNNQGKSCLIRALHTIIFNPRRVKKGFKKNTEGFIQGGKDFCKVTIICEGYPDIVWKCTKEGTSYEIGGEPFTKSVGGLALADLMPNHPFSLFEGECFNLSAQSARPLLFDRNGAGIFNLIDNLYEIVDVNTELQKFKNYKQDLYNQKENLEEKLNHNQDTIQKLEYLKNKVDITKLEQAFSKYQSMKEKYENWQSLKPLLTKKHEVTSLLATLDKTELEVIDYKLDKLKRIYEFRVLLAQYNNITKALKDNPIINLDTYKQVKDLQVTIEERESYKALKESAILKLNSLQEQLKDTICPTCGQKYRGT